MLLNIIEVLFGPGESAGWIALVYFLAGAAGTAGRVWLSPVIANKSSRMVVETVGGACGGLLLPQLGATFFPTTAATMAPIYKAALVFLITGSTSFAVGEVLARFGFKWTSNNEPKP